MSRKLPTQEMHKTLLNNTVICMYIVPLQRSFIENAMEKNYPLTLWERVQCKCYMY